jgi:outer membrane protein OmpA-like peptidoglycan-associated protein
VFRSPEHIVAALLAATAAFNGATPVPLPPSDAAGPVYDVVGPVESLDGSERESRAGSTVTVALTSDVLFEFDRADLTGDARSRLDRVAEQISADSAGGAVGVHGHTDDQGADDYNDDLSRRRAESVRQALADRLGADLTIEATGHGEREPAVPNVVDGRPSEENRSRNRRVEIVYDARQ